MKRIFNIVEEMPGSGITNNIKTHFFNSIAVLEFRADEEHKQHAIEYF